MTSKQLAHHVFSLTKRDIYTVSMAERQELLESLNLTLATWLESVPQARRVVSYGITTTSPVTQPITILPGSKDFAYDVGNPYPIGGYASEASALGSTAVLSGSPVINRLAGHGSLLYPHTGTETNVQLTLYGDAMHLPNDVWGIDGEIMLEERELLQRCTEMPRQDMLVLGQPTHWQLVSLAPLEEEQSRRFILRLYPIPDRPYRLSFPNLTFPQAFTMEDFFTERSLPFMDLEASLFITAAKGDFASWCTGLPEQLALGPIIQSGQKAMDTLTRMNRRPITGGTCAIGTPHGF